MSKEEEYKKLSVVEEANREIPQYVPEDEQLKVITSVFHKFRLTADARNRNLEFFDGANLIEYIEDSVRRFTTNIDERDDIEDWQARIHDPFTRNKVLAILGKIIQVLPIASFTGRGSEDVRRAILLTNLYEYSEELDDYEELMINLILEAIVKGTAIGYEGVTNYKKKIKNVKQYDDKLKFEEKVEQSCKIFTGIVPLEDFYPSSMSARNIKQMPLCFWRNQIPYDTFLMDWCMYENHKFVQPRATSTEVSDQRPYYMDFISQDVKPGNVELIRYYNKDVDEYVILANGVWLNPITIDEKPVISPLPFNHKELPFFDIKYDIFASSFFYGKSLPDRLKTLQDVLNVLSNMLLDQSFLTIFPPMLTNGVDSIEDDYLRPGRRTPVDTQGLALSDAFLKLDLGTPSGWHQYILEYTRKIMEQSSIDQVSSGTAGVGGRTTAEEIKLAASGVTSMLGLFGRLLNYGVKRKALLRASNILQFWTNPETPYVKSILGEGSEDKFNKAFSVFRLEGAVLTSGKRGSKIVEMYKDKADMPTKADLEGKAALMKLESGKPVELMAVDPTYLRNMQFDIKLVPNPKSEASKDIEKAMQLEKVRVYLSFFPELIDKQELAIQTAEKMGDDPTKVLKSELFNPPQETGTPAEQALKSNPNNPEAAKPVNQNPEGNLANNAIRGMMGGEGGSMSLRDLQGQMTQ